MLVPKRAELAEVHSVHRAAAVEVKRRVVGAERGAKSAEVDGVDGAVAVGVAEETGEWKTRVCAAGHHPPIAIEGPACDVADLGGIDRQHVATVRRRRPAE